MVVVPLNYFFFSITCFKFSLQSFDLNLDTVSPCEIRCLLRWFPPPPQILLTNQKRENKRKVAFFTVCCVFKYAWFLYFHCYVVFFFFFFLILCCLLAFVPNFLRILFHQFSMKFITYKKNLYNKLRKISSYL